MVCLQDMGQAHAWLGPVTRPKKPCSTHNRCYWGFWRGKGQWDRMLQALNCVGVERPEYLMGRHRPPRRGCHLGSFGWVSAHLLNQ